MLKQILLLLVLVNMQVAVGQENKKLDLKLKFSPFTALNYHSPHLTGGLEYIKNNSVGVEIGFGTRYIDKSPLAYIIEIDNQDKYYDSLVVQSKGNRFYIELKQYKELKSIHKIKDYKAFQYWGIGFYKIDDVRNRRITYSVPDKLNSTSSNFEDISVGISKSQIVVDFLYGYSVQYKNFSFDLQAMLGVMHREQKYINDPYFEKGYDTFHHWIWEKPMNTLLPSLNVNAKIAYKLFDFCKIKNSAY